MFRKRVRNTKSWKGNIRKEAYQAGKQYVSRRGKTVESKVVKSVKNCQLNCKYKCQNKISDDERSSVYETFYSLQSSTEKRHFILATSERFETARPLRKVQTVVVNNPENVDDPEDHNYSDTKNDEQPKSRRQYSFKYFFSIKGEKIKVCKKFYLSTLGISQKPVYTAHNKKDVITNTATPDLRGKSINSRRKPEGDADSARDHINSFHTVESHYCRANTKRLYLGAHLSVSKMYELYIEKCQADNIDPVKKSFYYKIFATEYNLGFHIPKSDRCDLCEKYKVARQSDTLTEELIEEYERHQVLKTEMRNARKKEKEQKTSPVLLFDLQNVILTPNAEISSLFYLRKLNVYNLTAYYTVTKKVYCALWNESCAGRSGNDIASAFRKILDCVVDENDISELTVWSDSCVPQNRNSIISNAVLDFLRDNPNITSITMKYSLPGHSCVQEVDSVHSCIERAMSKTEFYSPLGLIRILKQINQHNPYRIIQMQPRDFKDFASTAKLLNYKNIPYTKVAYLEFSQILHVINFKTTHDPYEPINTANIKYISTPLRKRKNNSPLSGNIGVAVLEIKPKVLKSVREIPEPKKKDIKAAFPYMPLQDRQFYSALFHELST